jgi:hypothetical protein
MEQETKRNFLAFIATEDPKTLVQSETEALGKPTSSPQVGHTDESVERENALQEKEVQAVEGDIFEMRRAAVDLAKSNSASELRCLLWSHTQLIGECRIRTGDQSS